MVGPIGCLRRLFTLALIGGAAFVAWRYREPLGEAWHRLRADKRPVAEVAAPSLAEGAEAKLALLKRGGASPRIALTQAEVQSLLEARGAEYFSPAVVAPRIEMEKGRLRLRFRVPTDRVPRIEGAGDLMAFLPDTAEVVAGGHLIPLEGGRIGVAVDELSAAHIPLPRRAIPKVLEQLGRRGESGLPPDAFVLPLPEGASAAYVSGDSLVFVGHSGK